MSLDRLESAVVSGDLKLLKELLSPAPPQASPPTSVGPTTLGRLLKRACEYGHQDIVSFLIKEKGADVNFIAQDNSPLMCAVESGQVAIVKQLVGEHHANVDWKNSNGDYALRVACWKGNTEIVRTLLAHSNQTNDEECMHSLLEIAVQRRHTEVVLCLLNKGAKVISEKRGSSILNTTCINGNVKMVKLLLENGGSAQVNFMVSQKSPLMEAVDGWHYEIVELLLKHKAGINAVNKNGIFPLLLAIRSGSPKVVTQLIEGGANINQMHKEETPLMIAIKQLGDEKAIAIVRALIDAGADVNMENTDKNTALILAVKAGSGEVTELLIKKGAHVNHRNTSGKSALMFAAHYYDIHKLLLEGGADANLCDEDIQTPLIMAVGSPLCSVDVVQLYIDKGADINWQDSHGNYALLLAVEKKRYETCDLLLKSSANGNLFRHVDGKSAASILHEDCTKQNIRHGTLTEMNHALWQKNIGGASLPTWITANVPAIATGVKRERDDSGTEDNARKKTWVSNQQATSLMTGDHLKIRRYLTPLGNQDLILVGVTLGLHFTRLKNMNPDHLLNEMVNSWLSRDDDVIRKTGPPTWESLCKALKDCDQNGIASDIRRNEEVN